MSIDRCIHIGPYVKCTFKRTTRSEPEFGCTNDSCKLNPVRRAEAGTLLRFGQGAGRYCSECGCLHGQVNVPISVRPDYSAITHERLRPIGESEDGDIIYLAANVDLAVGLGIDTDSEFHIDFAAFDVPADIAAFERAFAAELAAIREASATVKVAWGIHQFFT